MDEILDVRRSIADNRREASDLLKRVYDNALFDGKLVRQLVDEIFGMLRENASMDERVGYLLQYVISPMLERRTKEEEERDDRAAAEDVETLRQQLEQLRQAQRRFDQRLGEVEAYNLGRQLEDPPASMPRLSRREEP